MMLLKLVSRMDREKFTSRVVSLLNSGPVAQRIHDLGIEISSLGLSRGMPTPGAFLRLVRIIRAARPDIVQTWLYHADLIGLLAAKLAWYGKAVWNIRCSDMELANYRRMTALTLAVNAKLSRFPACVIANSYNAKEYHKKLGYRPKRFEVIPNGFDMKRFKPDAEAAAGVRHELGIPERAPIIGLVARFDPMKGHETFLEAARILCVKRPDVHYLLCGDNITMDNQVLAQTARKSGLGEELHLLGRREDVPRIMAALTVATLCSSYGEGFANVVGEAMACCVPCVVTDVGDSAYIVGDTGLVVPPRNPCALADAWNRVLSINGNDRHALGLSARKRVTSLFSIDAITEQYEKLYCEIVKKA